MPNLKSAKKRLRRNATQAEVNAPVRTRIKTTRRKFMEIVATGNDAEGSAAFRTYCSALDRAVKTGIIKRNTAIRRKGRAANRLRAVVAAASAQPTPQPTSGE